MNKTILLFSVLIPMLFSIPLGCDRGPAGDDDDAAVFAVERQYADGPLAVEIRLDRDEIDIAGTVNLYIAAIVEDGYVPVMPSLAAGEKFEFGILGSDSEPTKLLDGGRLSYSRHWRLEPLSAGDLTIPGLEFAVSAKGGEHECITITTEPLELKVTSPLAAGEDIGEIADIKSIVPLGGGRAGWRIWAAIAGGLFLAAFAGLMLYRARNTEPVRIFKPAHELAYERLRQLQADRLIERGRTKEFYERISMIVRRYIEDRFELRAPELTSEEFLYQLGNADSLAESHKAALQDFLEQADLVKFASARPRADQIRLTGEAAERFVTATRDDSKQVEVTPSTAR